MTAPRVRLPGEPYPGLRPFLDFEAALLFGRERQVRDVIERLAATQFVAVLGGSGSGKSSLIHAGVVPELRSFGIPGAGDLWLPATFTPGTDVDAASSAARRHTPVTRLARRFAGLLRSRGDADADRRRVDEIAEVFRQDAGFARLLEVYVGELAVPAGPDPLDARVLIVVDQFEEIFHPTNQGVDDARLLVERVLDHFFNPHPRCHVVLTMRSEHLADCAAYLELPDAINKSSYLIRRLDADELRSAIVAPAQRFLRLVARTRTADVPALPDHVAFEPAVLARLQRDVQAITHDPDHLPLLQHLLARLWEAAIARERGDGTRSTETKTMVETVGPVPATITGADLARAVRADGGVDPSAVDPRVNALRASVENWPEAIFRNLDDVAREQLQRVLRRLAFKDPNTGLYTQQRIEVDDAARLLGADRGRADLRALLGDGFLGSVDYLYWDDQDPDRVTLKVSHESFIRGWTRLRQLVDEESARFDEFVGVLRKVADWSDHGRGDDYLLETGERRRLADSGFFDRLATGGQRAGWLRFVTLDRDGARLARAEPELDAFLAASQQRLLERAHGERRTRRIIRVLVVATVLIGLLPAALISALVQGPTLVRAEQAFDAANVANRVRVDRRQERVGDSADALARLLRAAELLGRARAGEGSLRLATSARVLDSTAAAHLFGLQQEFLRNVFARVEPTVNTTLRDVMTSSIWRAGLPVQAGEGGDAGAPRPYAMPEIVAGASCELAGGRDSAEPVRNGRIFIAARAAMSGSAGTADGDGDEPVDGAVVRRAILHPARETRDGRFELYAASISADGRCTAGPPLVAMPAALDARGVIDAGLRYVYIAVGGRSAERPALIVQEIDWERALDGELRDIRRHTLTTITDPGAIAAVRDVAGPAGAAVVPTWAVAGGRRVEVGDKRWRVVDRQAQRLPALPPAGELAPLVALAPDSTCAGLGSAIDSPPGFRVDSRELGRHCVHAATGWLAPDGVSPPARAEVRVAIHERPARSEPVVPGELPPEAIAALDPFARVPQRDGEPGRSLWHVGVGGRHDGWLFLSSADGSRVWGLPWNTAALARLGCDLQRANEPVDIGLTAARSCGRR